MASEANKRIAKNTVMLYIRMLFSMVVSLYTSRIVLNTLGVEDYGIYNVVGGIITMFSFLNGAMAAGTQRFLTFELGKNDAIQLSRVFSMSMSIHLMIALVVFVLGETLGLWFVNTQLTIPSERMAAANWVYQFSVLSAMVGIWSVPYNASIIAHERMNVYAYVSILEVILRLLIVFLLQWFGFDKLKFYAVLVFSVSLTIRFIYGRYSKLHFSETRFKFYWNKDLFNTLVSYAGWNLWGNLAVVAHDQGVNILLNIFFGPAVNAARGIAYSVKAAVYSFVQNFQVAMNPQIIKSFASGDFKNMHQLIFQGSKFSFFLLFFLSLPILLETEMIIKLWLKIVPEYAVIFTRLVVINILIESLSGPLVTAAQASGRIKLYQIVVGGLILLILPISYMFLKIGFPPEVAFCVSIFISIIALFARLIILRRLVKLKAAKFLAEVVGKSLSVSLISAPLPYYIYSSYDDSLRRLLLVVCISIICSTSAIYFFGLNKIERTYLAIQFKKIKQKITRNLFKKL
jgi:O-antigen/teichoic acid export membrane protein